MLLQLVNNSIKSSTISPCLCVLLARGLSLLGCSQDSHVTIVSAKHVTKRRLGPWLRTRVHFFKTSHGCNILLILLQQVGFNTPSCGVLLIQAHKHPHALRSGVQSTEHLITWSQFYRPAHPSFPSTLPHLQAFPTATSCFVISELFVSDSTPQSHIIMLYYSFV